MGMWEEIARVEKLVFRGEFRQALDRFGLVVQDFEALAPTWDGPKTERVNAILEQINTSIESRDYLLFADLLHHKLTPALKSGLN